MQTSPSPPRLKTSPPRSPLANLVFQIQIVTIVALATATLFTAWTPAGLLPGGLADQFPFAVQPSVIEGGAAGPATPTPRPLPRIGLVAGHWGNDSGAVCPDGLTEMEVNLNIATMAQRMLTDKGFQVDLLKEFDPALEDYRALALVSIHADSCTFINNEATGFKVAAALGNDVTQAEKAARLTACLRTRYADKSDMPVHNSITPDMTYYHAFDEIHQETTAAIIEVGFLNLDRQKLTGQPNLLAEGIVDGVMCFIYNESVSITPPTQP